MLLKDYDFSLQKNRDKQIWTDKDLWYFFFLGSMLGLLVGFLIGL